MASVTNPSADPLLVEELHAEVGDALRVVARYRDGRYELSYVREDVDGLYTTDELDAVFDDLVLEGVQQSRLERLFQAGRLEGSMLTFEAAHVFHFVSDDESGLFVSIDTGAGVDVEALTATGKKHL